MTRLKEDNFLLTIYEILSLADIVFDSKSILTNIKSINTAVHFLASVMIKDTPKPIVCAMQDGNICKLVY